MRIEKEGFVLHLEGTWCEISNKYAVLESGDVAVNEEDIPAGFAEKKLDRYIETHKIRGYGKVDGCVKRVACDERTKEYSWTMIHTWCRSLIMSWYLWASYGADANIRMKCLTG